jgi:hypothetical protein
MSSFRPNRIATGGRVRTRLPAVFSLAVLALLVTFAFGVFAGCAFRSRPPDLAAQVAVARTPADHLAIARTLSAQASEYAAAAAYHRSLAAKYETLAGPGAQYRSYDRSDLRMAEHCRKVAEDLERAASDLTQLAHERERLAASLQGKGP